MAFWVTLAAIFNALQLLALPGFPLWVHTVLVIAATVTSILAARGSTVATGDTKAVASAAKDLGIINSKDLKVVEEVVEHI